MKKKNWIVIYTRRDSVSYYSYSVPSTKQVAKDLFDIFDDAKYLVRNAFFIVSWIYNFY